MNPTPEWERVPHGPVRTYGYSHVEDAFYEYAKATYPDITVDRFFATGVYSELKDLQERLSASRVHTP